MSPSLEYLERCAAETGFQVIPIEKVVRLGELAADVGGRAAETMRTPEFRSWFVALSAVLKRPLASYGRERVESRVTDRTVAEQIRPMVAVVAPPAHELVERAWAVVGPLLTLERREAAYLEANERGELRLDYLFPDNPDEATRIAAHPAILWKVQNVRIHRSLEGGSREQRRPPKK